MPGCCVNNCNNRSERGFRLFRVPNGKNTEKRQEWLKLIGRNTLPERADICEVHFSEDQFEKNRADGKKLLRPFAKPNFKLAVSYSRIDVYKENINFLRDFMEIVRGITVGNGAWKPFQSGLLLCTQTALDVQAEYLEKHNFQFLLLGRCTQDALENLFSQIRSRKSVPDARKFKQTFRLICLSQFQANINRGNYSVSNSQDLINYCDKIKHFDSKNTSIEERSLQNNEDLWDVNIYQSLLGDESDLNDTIQAALYHLIGALLFKIKKTFYIVIIVLIS
ncbi:PREDICTED: uncharacterized protein LOC105571100 [Vollenhovia emeryi]|uniref:uncharacterized protein LOC105571100 n=1 Tax=Vollenhovia emeryi TaxID=411798 RepID=UPI0005F48F1B|nr:PREDICTED: uncharacterized protein LOC105571100 [Vollenhovia emeryi]